MAPEVLTGNTYTESADIYSMGLVRDQESYLSTGLTLIYGQVLWEMLTGKCPYEGMKQVEVSFVRLTLDVIITVL